MRSDLQCDESRPGVLRRFYLGTGKRLLDVLVSLAVLTLLSPLLLIVAVLIWCKLGRPVIFSQLRTGRDVRPFLLYKFRTMKDLRDQNGCLLPDGERLTRFGALLRAYSLVDCRNWSTF